MALVDVVRKRNCARVAAWCVPEGKNEPYFLNIRSPRGSQMFPGGGVEDGEGIKSAALREFQEELGYQALTLEDTMLEDDFTTMREGVPTRISLSLLLAQTSPQIYGQKLDVNEEVQDYDWLTYSQTMDSLSFKSQKDLFGKLVVCSKQLAPYKNHFF